MGKVISGNFGGAKSSVPPVTSVAGLAKRRRRGQLPNSLLREREILASDKIISLYAKAAHRAIIIFDSFQEGDTPEEAETGLKKEEFSGLRQVGDNGVEIEWEDYSKKEILERLGTIIEDGHLRDDQRKILLDFYSEIERGCPEKLGRMLGADQVNASTELLEKTAETVELIQRNILSIEERIDEFVKIDSQLSKVREKIMGLNTVVGQLVGKAERLEDIKDSVLRKAVEEYLKELHMEPDLDELEQICEAHLENMVNGKGELELNPMRFTKSPEELAKLAVALSMKVELLVRSIKLANLGKNMMKAMVRGDEAKPKEEMQ